jgi:hypothetical protein
LGAPTGHKAERRQYDRPSEASHLFNHAKRCRVVPRAKPNSHNENFSNIGKTTKVVSKCFAAGRMAAATPAL